jgi:hypothetical protein
MSGGVKAGLLFGLVAIPLTIALSFVPYVGAFCCGPLLGLGLGTAAGYLGLYWSSPDARIGQGLLAGGLAGVGSLIGSVIFFIVAVMIATSIPEFEQTLQDALEQQGAGSQMTLEDMRLMMSFAGPVAGACLGAIGLLFSFGGGALGAWLRIRQRNQVPPAPPSVVSSQ